MNSRPGTAVKIGREEFDEFARAGSFAIGPFVSGDRNTPWSQREVWGRLDDGRDVWANHE